MLIKLMKHEFRATGRVMGPLYLVLLVTAIGANLSTRGLLETNSSFLNMLGGLLVVAFVFAIMGVCLMSLVLMVQRFYKNLLGDEGYVMFTLPASVHQQVWSKLIVSAVWFAATLLAVCAAGTIMVYEVGFMKAFFHGLGEVFRQLTAYYALNGTALVLEFLLLCFVTCCAMCLQFYAAMAVGHSFPNHKGLMSVVFFFVFQFAVQLMGSLLIVFLDESPFHRWLLQLTDWQLSGMAATHLLMIVLIFGVVLYGAIFYVVTTFFLKRHLNLE
ncbi:hypothetical protein SAMN05216343_10874 [Oscillibacter sp. PC13]|uniref:hypothetical protein n=1 Tax=Oscillibacter sp. PC13 TaxID=1855299 RepID=UPI0008EE5F48|nr:hypothetical protein [Oscillibacter sp. PC13]SFP49665.1 hypothetical protein SAMN05216343_10874 [Oscillibacter sp. PC13]